MSTIFAPRPLLRPSTQFDTVSGAPIQLFGFTLPEAGFAAKALGLPEIELPQSETAKQLDAASVKAGFDVLQFFGDLFSGGKSQSVMQQQSEAAKKIVEGGGKPEGAKEKAPSGSPPPSPPRKFPNFLTSGDSNNGGSPSRRESGGGLKPSDFKVPAQIAATGAAGAGAAALINEGLKEVGDTIGEAMLAITDPLGLSQDSDGDGKPDNKNLGRLIAIGFIALILIGGTLYVVSRAK